MVTSDLSTPPGSSSAPAETPRGGPPARLCCFSPQSSLGLASVCSQPVLGGAESCGALMDNYPGVKPTLRCNEQYGKGVAKAPWRYGKGSVARAVSQACFHTSSIHPRACHTIKPWNKGQDAGRVKKHTRFPIRDAMSPTLQLYSHIHK